MSDAAFVRSLAEKQAENPAAYDFSDIPDAPSVKGSRRRKSSASAAPEEAVATMEDMTGDYKHVKGAFHVRAPRIKQIRQIISTARESGEKAGQGDVLAVFDALVTMARFLLFVQQPEGNWSSATADEIEEAFTAEDLQKLVTDHTGLNFDNSGE